MKRSILATIVLALLNVTGCSTPPKPVQVNDSATPYSTAHSRCSTEMNSRITSQGRDGNPGVRQSAIGAVAQSAFASFFQSDNLGYNAYRECMYKNGWRLENQ